MTSITRTNKSYSKSAQSYIIALSDTSSDIATGTNIESFRFDFECELSCVFIEVDSAQPPTGGDIICDVNFEGATIFIEKPKILATESKSQNIDFFSKKIFQQGDEITFDVDQVGSGDTGKRLKIHLIINL